MTAKPLLLAEPPPPPPQPAPPTEVRITNFDKTKQAKLQQEMTNQVESLQEEASIVFDSDNINRRSRDLKAWCIADACGGRRGVSRGVR
jgi:hypothetical protein